MDQPGLSELGQRAMIIDLDRFNELKLNTQHVNLIFGHPLHHVFDGFTPTF